MTTPRPPAVAPAGSRTAALAAAVTVLLWACAFVAIRPLVPVLGPDGLAGARLLVASLGLAVAAPFLGVRRPDRADLPRLAGCGLAGMTAYQLLLNAGERSVQAGTASLLVNTAPLFVLPLAAVLLAERPTRRALAGIAIGFAGVALIAVGRSPGGPGPAFSPDSLLVVGAAAAQALYFVLQKPLLDRYRPVEVVAYATWAGTLAVLPIAAPALTRVPRLDGAGLAALVFLGLGASALGFVCWAMASTTIGVGRATATLYAVPPVAVLVGLLALDERPAPLALAGGALALAGVVVARSHPRAHHPDPRRDHQLRPGNSGSARRVGACAVILAGWGERGDREDGVRPGVASAGSGRRRPGRRGRRPAGSRPAPG